MKQGGKSIGEFTTDANGLFTFNTKVTEPGLATYQVVITAGSKNTAGISDEITVLVR